MFPKRASFLQNCLLRVLPNFYPSILPIFWHPWHFATLATWICLFVLILTCFRALSWVSAATAVRTFLQKFQMTSFFHLSQEGKMLGAAEEHTPASSENWEWFNCRGVQFQQIIGWLKIRPLLLPLWKVHQKIYIGECLQWCQKIVATKPPFAWNAIWQNKCCCYFGKGGCCR